MYRLVVSTQKEKEGNGQCRTTFVNIQQIDKARQQRGWKCKQKKKMKSKFAWKPTENEKMKREKMTK